MAYEKHEWASGETITANLLNHMEDGISEGGSGYECTEIETLLTEETVTTVIPEGGQYPQADFSYSQFIDADVVKVVFDEVEYICEKQWHEFNLCEYGAEQIAETGIFDWSKYPFRIQSTFLGTSIATETEGAHHIILYAVNTSIESNSCFTKAVETIGAGLMISIDSTNSCGGIVFNVTPKQLLEAMKRKIPLLLNLYMDSTESATHYTIALSGSCTYSSQEHKYTVQCTFVSPDADPPEISLFTAYSPSLNEKLTTVICNEEG